MLKTKKAKIDHNPQLKALTPKEEKEIKEILDSEDTDEVTTYFNTPEMLECINKCCFKDGQPIFIYACINQLNHARALLELHDIDLTVKSNDFGDSVLGVLIVNRPRINNSFCDLILKKMYEKLMFVSKDDLELAKSFLFKKNSNEINKEVTKLYKNMQNHNKKLAATQNTASGTQPQESTPTITPVPETIPAEPAITMPNETVPLLNKKMINDLKEKDPDCAEVLKLEETLAAKYQAIISRIEQAGTVKTRLENMLPLFEKFKQDREIFKQAKETVVNSGKDLTDAREQLVTYLEQNSLDIVNIADTYSCVVPGLEETVKRFVVESTVFKPEQPVIQQPTPKYGPFIPQFTEARNCISPRPGSRNSSAGFLSADQVADAFKADSPRRGLVDSPSW